MKFIFTVLFTFFFLGSFEQTSAAIEQHLLGQLKKINFWSTQNTSETINAEDSLSKANEDFRNTLLDYTSKYPETLQNDFKKLKEEGMTIATSENGLFRIYSWDTWMGGSMHIFENVYQFKINEKTFSKMIYDTTTEGIGYWYSNIYSLKKDDDTYYIAIRHGILSTSDAYEGVKVFGIKNDFLSETIKIFETTTGIKNTLGFSFNSFSKEKIVPPTTDLISYNTQTQTLSMYIINNKSNVTSKLLLYKFDGKHFIKSQKH